MKIYILCDSRDIDGESFQGVFATLAEAQQAAVTIEKSSFYHRDLDVWTESGGTWRARVSGSIGDFWSVYEYEAPSVLSPFDRRCADALADEVDALVRTRGLDSRSSAADALLDYRNPPMSPRSDRLVALEAEVSRLREVQSCEKWSAARTAARHEGPKYIVLRQRETEPWEVYYFEDRDQAVACYEQKAAQWTMCYLLVPLAELEKLANESSAQSEQLERLASGLRVTESAADDSRRFWRDRADKTFPEAVARAEAIAWKMISEAEAKGRKEVEAWKAPIPMLLYCPNCGAQHIDAPQPEKGWTNPPHKSHECQHCFGPDGDGYTWRPCDRPTNGVAALTTKGANDQDPKPPLVAEMRDELHDLRNWQMELSER